MMDTSVYGQQVTQSMMITVKSAPATIAGICVNSRCGDQFNATNAMVELLTSVSQNKRPAVAHVLLHYYSIYCPLIINDTAQIPSSILRPQTEAVLTSAEGQVRHWARAYKKRTVITFAQERYPGLTI